MSFDASVPPRAYYREMAALAKKRIVEYIHTDEFSPVLFKLKLSKGLKEIVLDRTFQGYLYPKKRKLIIVDIKTFVKTNRSKYELAGGVPVNIVGPVASSDGFVDFDIANHIPGFVTTLTSISSLFLHKNNVLEVDRAIAAERSFAAQLFGEKIPVEEKFVDDIPEFEIPLDPTIFDLIVYMSQAN